jgi:glycosyltransferase involved in cell wall biosynthesis
LPALPQARQVPQARQELATDMRILIALTYYRPHYSGLTIYAERLARALVGRGHRVTVLTSRYDRNLPRQERMDGLEVVRLDVGLHVSKGVIMPSMLYWAWRYARQSDVLHLHLPQLDAAYLAIVGRLLKKPVVLTYHCDLRLPHGPIHLAANQVSHLANHLSARLANVIVTNTRDYAENSTFLQRYLSKVQPVFPPAEVAPVSEASRTAFRAKAGIIPGQRIIGMAARLATEKGVEFLAQALPLVMEKYPMARVLFVGQHENVFGEEPYARRLAPLIESLGEHWTFLGTLSPLELSAFYHECEVTVLPSLNSTESFGLVQVESMLCGTPVVASDLPGVRQPVAISSMGRIIPPADAPALAKAILAILDQPEGYRGDPGNFSDRFAPETVAGAYEEIFEGLLSPEVQDKRIVHLSTELGH